MNDLNVQHYFHLTKKFICMMQKGYNFLDHVNKIKTFGDQLVCSKVRMENKNIVMTFLEIFSVLYNYLITAMGTIPLMENIMDCITTSFMSKMFKCDEITIAHPSIISPRTTMDQKRTMKWRLGLVAYR